MIFQPIYFLPISKCHCWQQQRQRHLLPPPPLPFTVSHSPRAAASSSSAHCSCAEELFIATASILSTGKLITQSPLVPPSTPCSWISQDIFLRSAPGQHLLEIYSLPPAFAAPFCLSSFPPLGRLASGTSKAPVLVAVSVRSLFGCKIWYKEERESRERKGGSCGNYSAMRPNARLDSVVFQLTPTRTRWEHPRSAHVAALIRWIVLSFVEF